MPADSLVILHGRDRLYAVNGKKFTREELNKFLALMRKPYIIFDEQVMSPEEEAAERDRRDRQP